MSIESKNVIMEQPIDENVVGSSNFAMSTHRSSRISQFSSRGGSRRGSIRDSNRSKKQDDDESGGIYKKSFMAKVIDTQMENKKRRKSTFKFLQNKKSRRGSVKLNKRNSVIKT
jgi:hypothetical protein